MRQANAPVMSSGALIALGDGQSGARANTGQSSAFMCGMICGVPVDRLRSMAIMSARAACGVPKRQVVRIDVGVDIEVVDQARAVVLALPHAVEIPGDEEQRAAESREPLAGSQLMTAAWSGVSRAWKGRLCAQRQVEQEYGARAEVRAHPDPEALRTQSDPTEPDSNERQGKAQRDDA